MSLEFGASLFEVLYFQLQNISVLSHFTLHTQKRELNGSCTILRDVMSLQMLVDQAHMSIVLMEMRY